jgi:hypothetical protein
MTGLALKYALFLVCRGWGRARERLIVADSVAPQQIESGKTDNWVGPVAVVSRVGRQHEDGANPGAGL